MTKFIVNGKQGYKTYHDWKAFWGMKGAPSTPPVPPGPDPTEPFYVESRGNNMVVSIQKNASPAPTVNNIEYSLDKTTWQSLGSTSTTALTINVPAGDKVWLRATANTWGSNSGYFNNINANVPFNIGGNILSLLFGSNFDETTRITAMNAFYGLFLGDTLYLIDASKLILPSTTPSTRCYKYMFSSCQALTQAPALPATTLGTYCYEGMFQGCTALTQTPALPATNISWGSYRFMFSGCTSLTQAPTLPASSVASYGYQYMFSGCTSLTQAPALPASYVGDYGYGYMFAGCTALTTAPALPATTLTDYCYEGMFSDCYSLYIAPILPATTLANYCYYGMFSNCYSLYIAPILPATTLRPGCYTNMFAYCSSLNYIKCLAVDDVDGYGDFRTYCEGWVDGVSSSGTFIASDNYYTGWYWGKDGVPEGWTTETESGNYFEPTSEGGGGSQIYQSNELTVYEMGSEQGGYQVEANGSNMEVPDFNGYDYRFAMMKISADQGNWRDAYMTPYLGNGVTAYISNPVSDDGTCPFSYSDGDEYDYRYSLTSSDDGNQISVQIEQGYCIWVKFVKNQGTYSYNTPYITMDF